MSLTIHRAGPADLDTVVTFNRLLAEESEGKQLDDNLLRPGVAAVLADPTKGLYHLALLNGSAVGQMMVTFEWSDWRNGWFWWIQSVYVVAEHRRQGVFRVLFDQVVASARAAGNVIGLRLYVEEENLQAQQTYLRHGLHKTTYFVMEQYPLP